MNFDINGLLKQALSGGAGLNNLLSQLDGMGGKFQQAAMMIKGKNAQQLQTFAQNLAQEYNVDLNQLLGAFGVRPQ